ncbi:MAG TPA: NTP transferase domain-containing protein [Tepidisphaeraceae bacterium]|nr:NTP transferase domain-containing protein [Tepidisphaeraceae bacterium]
MSLTAIILAAGKSTRMKSKRPKVLQDVCGKPMLHYVLKACYDAGCTRVLVVVGHGKDEVMAQFAGDPRIHWVEQTEQLGTGHAVRMCQSELKKLHGDVFILAGDGPLIRGEVLRTLASAHRQEHAAASMATAMLDDPTGYGRVVRDKAGNFVAIVEQVDCTPEQRAIREVFPSYYCVKVEELLWALDKLTPNNKKGEYYLTDIYGHLRDAGRKVFAFQAVTPEDVLAVNTRQQLAEVDLVMQDRIQRQHRDNGVTIVSSTCTYIEDGVTIGVDTVVQPFTFIGRDSSIGAECVIGPYGVIPREGIVPEGTTVAGNVTPDTAVLKV